MKKIYASMFALAMGACITAGARTYQRATLSLDDLQPRSFEKAEKVIPTDLKVSNKVQRVKANAGEEWINLGTGIFVEGIFGLGQINVTVEESAATPGYYRVPDAFTGVSPDALPFEIDASDPGFVIIPEQETGLSVTFNLQDGSQLSGPLTIMSYSYYFLINDVSPEEFLADPELAGSNITMNEGVITIPELAIIGIVGDSERALLINDEMVLALPGAEYVPEWGDIKVGRMKDTFFEAGFNGYTAQETDVLVQKNNRVEGVYRIIDPWYRVFGKTEPSAEAGIYFVIDASQPDWVYIPAQPTGISVSGSSGSYGVAYITGASSFYETKEEQLASEDAEYNITLNTETNVITFPTGIFTQNGKDYNLSCIYVRFPYATSGYDPQYFYSWTLTANENGYINLPEFTGINSVSVDNSDAPVEYYNIQGVRVNNPVAGQLYIVKKGNEVSKRIMR